MGSSQRPMTLGPEVHACAVFMSFTCVSVIQTPRRLRRVTDIWRAKHLLLFKGKHLLSGYFLIRMSTCSGCSKLCRAPQEIRKGRGPVLPCPDNGWGLMGFFHTGGPGLACLQITLGLSFSHVLLVFHVCLAICLSL